VAAPALSGVESIKHASAAMLASPMATLLLLELMLPDI